MFLQASYLLCRVLPRQRPLSGLVVIRCRAMGGNPVKVRWRPFLPRHSTPHLLVRERARRMDRSATCGLMDTGSDSIRRCCLIRRARSWHIRASTSPLAAASLGPPRGQVQLAVTRVATCLRFRVLSRWADPDSSRQDLPLRPERWPGRRSAPVQSPALKSRCQPRLFGQAGSPPGLAPWEKCLKSESQISTTKPP